MNNFLKIKFVTLIFLLCVFPCIIRAEGLTGDDICDVYKTVNCPIMSILNDRSNPDRQKLVVEELYQNMGLYKQVLLDYISKEREWKEGEIIVAQDIALEVAIMIAGISGDHDYFEPLFTLLQNDPYVSTCIYNCAITFALSVSSDKEDIERIKELEKEDREYEYGDIVGGAVKDVINEWERLRSAHPTPLEERRQQAKELMQIADDDEQSKYEKLTELSQDKLIEMAADSSKGKYIDRLMPLIALMEIADSEDTIVKLLGIMVTLNPNYYDGADEFRNAIISAIENVLIQKAKLKRMQSQ